jgi:hypothetical protein
MWKIVGYVNGRARPLKWEWNEGPAVRRTIRRTVSSVVSGEAQAADGEFAALFDEFGSSGEDIDGSGEVEGRVSVPSLGLESLDAWASFHLEEDEPSEDAEILAGQVLHAGTWHPGERLLVS